MAFGKEVVVMASVATAVTVMLSACVAVCDAASVTLTVKLLVPAVVGTPEMIPLAAASARPTGKLPEEIDQV